MATSILAAGSRNSAGDTRRVSSWSRLCRAVFCAVLPLSLLGCRSAPPPVVLAAGERSSAPTLQIGDPAPHLSVSQWISGHAEADSAGKVRVVDFWATWCGPCIASLPLLADAQRRHGTAIDAIALTTIDENNTIERVKHMASRRSQAWGVPVGVRIAVDEGDQTARAFRVAMRDTAIPRTVVIDPAGRIAWWGHPADAAPVIDAVVAGTWDLAAARASANTAAADATRGRTIVDKYLAAIDAEDQQARLTLTEEACTIPIAHTSGMSPPWWAWTARVALLGNLGRTDEARTIALQAAELDGIRDEPSALGDLVAVLPSAHVQVRRDLAERAVARVEQLEATPPGNTWDAFLREAMYEPYGYVFAQTSDAFAKAGVHDRAIELLKRAIERAPDDTRFVGNKTVLTEQLKKLEDAAQ